ncbi:hypothetical protein K490DRAFT_42506 [Saccharata proteae CBS 121410]|uniref:DNA repair and recombination protein RAD26 n=1 Tax=Saccharata proteae CBS 121410 TaxID=1314787 RepID=A0A9P4HV64_9PEZI|nr:hypothetical protein K490DRAFT_42506 [Saccharata proteae CBS 121410]
MIQKPFKSPLLTRRPSEQPRIPQDAGSEPPPKKRRVSRDKDEQPVAIPSKPAQVGPRKPLQVVNPAAEVNSAPAGIDGYYNVLWRKFTTKKNKTWDGDGVLSVTNGYAHLQDISGRDMGKTPWKTPLLPGSTLSVGGKELEVDSIIPRQDFLAGKPFLGAVSAPKPAPEPTGPKLGMKKQAKQDKIEAKQIEKVNPVAQSQASKIHFKNPLLSTTVMPKVSKAPVPQPRHDPTAPGALVMKRPARADMKGKQIVDVVVDPLLCKNLREHQREGVRFMYECVMGLKLADGQGAILADEMGLGKTLQTIALVWTLLKQNPIHEEPPVVKKAVVICPAGVIDNWRKEFRKWLGNERIGVFVCGEKSRIRDFTKGRAYNVMIIGYERLLKVKAELEKGPPIDLVIADEGHRLKTAMNKSAAVIRALSSRTVILSGTPMSNNLTEFYFMIDLIHPGLLGKPATFKKEFEVPITKGNQEDATAKDREKGDARKKEFEELTKSFMIRRTADILAQYLPPKTEYILFCQPTAAQKEVYRSVLSSPLFGSALGNNEAAFQLIHVLKKVCNSPSLLTASSSDDPAPAISTLLSTVPKKYLSSPGASSKFQVLDSLLHHIRSTTTEKVVIVSNYTTTLDMLAKLLTSLSYTHLRLDGSVPTKKRQPLVDKFNAASADSCFAFLLSAKSGGVGINLIGASRLVLYDIDWNPSIDQQAMARIHRDGQKLPCKIYRFLTMGALDEKIYQRQLSKLGLADSVIDNKSAAPSFSKEELRRLFTLDEGDKCQTHELLGCECEGRGNDGGKLLDEAETMVAVGDSADEEEDDEPLPDLPSLMKASQVDVDKLEERIKINKGRGKGAGKVGVSALMQYAHVDTSLLRERKAGTQTWHSMDEEYEEPSKEVEEFVDDAVLLNVLREEGSRVKFLFAKANT